MTIDSPHASVRIVMRRRRFLGLLVVGCAGCARQPDWIESTLVTVDVSGEWAGSTLAGSNPGTIEMTLQQAGQKVTGEAQYSGWNAAQFPNGPVSGMVSGDVLRLVTLDGRRRFFFRADGDTMQGYVLVAGGAWSTFGLRRRKP